MFSSGQVNIVLCFSNKKEANNLSMQLSDIVPNIHFIFAATFDELIFEINNTNKVACFIVEENFLDCPSTDLIEHIKKNQKFKKSVISVFSENLKNIDNKFFEKNTDYIFDLSFELKKVVVSLKELVLKNIEPIIPRNYNVMVVDNSPEILDIITLHLNDMGHEKVDLCMGTKDAKQKLQANDYDLLLLDWNLDDGTCLDIIESIKNKSVSARTKAAIIVVITGRDDVDDIMTLLQYGVKDHIIKPFGLKEFEDKIAYALEKNIKRV